MWRRMCCSSAAPSSLPVHVLLDIDNTLITRVPRSQRKFLTLTKEAPSLEVRPHVLDFLSLLLCHRALDTSRVHVQVSLFTKQAQLYCAAVGRALLEQCAGGTMAAAPDCFALLLGGDSCCLDVDDGLGWRKSVCVTSCPFTTLLVDDKADNFVPVECATGHCLLVPSFRSRHDDADITFDASALRRGTTTELDTESRGQDFLERLVGAGGEVPSAFETTPTLLPVLEAFVHVCHDAHEALCNANMQHGAHGLTHHATSEMCTTTSKTLTCFDFLQLPCTSAYRAEWERFHQPFEHEIFPILAQC